MIFLRFRVAAGPGQNARADNKTHSHSVEIIILLSIDSNYEEEGIGYDFR